MNEHTKFVFREPKNIIELEDLIRLRYRIFKITHPNLVSNNKHGLDLDNFDPYANHYGVYKLDSNGEQPVGYLRVIISEPTKFGVMIQRIARRYDLDNLINNQPVFKLPTMMLNSNAKDVIGNLIKSIHSKDQKLFEASRLCLLPEVASLRLSRFLVESVVAILFYDSSNQNTIISCSVAHEKLYSSCYFKPIVGLERIQFLGTSDLRAVTMFLGQDIKNNLPSEKKEKWALIANEFKIAGRIEFCKNVNLFAV